MREQAGGAKPTAQRRERHNQLKSSAKVGGLPILQGGSGDVFTYDPDKVTDEEIESMY